MTLGAGEPAAGPWRAVPIGVLLALVLDHGPAPAGRPWIVAVDGRAGSGKSTLADRLCRGLPNAAVVHTDDFIGYSFFGWNDLLVEGVLRPLRAGCAVHYRPPGGDPHGGRGPIAIAAGLDLVVVEGVGSSRTALGPWIDRSAWVQADVEEAVRRGIARDGGPEVAGALWGEWMVEEVAFLAQDRPWERASLIVAGTPSQPYGRDTEVLVAPALVHHPLSASALFAHTHTRAHPWLPGRRARGARVGGGALPPACLWLPG